MTSLLTTKEAMSYLQVSRPTLMRYVYECGLKASRVGRDYRFSKENIDRFLKENEV